LGRTPPFFLEEESRGPYQLTVPRKGGHSVVKGERALLGQKSRRSRLKGGRPRGEGGCFCGKKKVVAKFGE